ncbi:MAG: glycine cleavage system protein GcvH [Alphaproteobacteria bacterium]|nr:glycine cleavage system protein GcvH [Alphaproteobacteria bacterium]MBL6777102.1 glycine cleavage system protein GcvH [Alphaproteobacteria bacterium]
MEKFTQEHEWIRLDEDIATIGITDHAQSELGDIVFVELPEIGTKVSSGGEMATVESFKAASSVYAPVTGEVVEINETLGDDPAQVNTEPMGAGWFVKVKMDDVSQLDKLMDEAAYLALVS